MSTFLGPYRERMVEILQGMAGKGVDHPGTEEEFVDFLMPSDLETEVTRNAVKKQYTCSLVVRAAWRMLGADHRRLKEPYRNGMGPADVEEIGKAMKARYTYKGPDGDRPRVGDSFYVATPEGKREHFGTITKVLSIAPNTWTFKAVEGGQGTNGANIEEKTSVWRLEKNRAYIGDRVVICWYDLDKILGADVSPTS